MQTRQLINRTLGDEGLTRGLGDAEAKIMVEWLVEWFDLLTEAGLRLEALTPVWQRLCRRCRVFARLVALWCHQANWAGALQLAACERLEFAPLPSLADPCELMQQLLDREDERLCELLQVV
jgi:hypothetical protein